MDRLGRYYVGAIVADRQALARISHYRNLILGINEEVSQKEHMTVLPPMEATFEQASSINFGAGLATLKSDHPTKTTIFEMRGMDLLEFDGESFVVVPVTPFSSGQESWDAYVKRVRERFLKTGIAYRNKIPDEYRPHITVVGGRVLAGHRRLSAIISENRQAPPLYFHVAFLDVYAKYKSGYAPISDDPALE